MEPKTKRTDKIQIVKGIKTMGLTIVLMFLGPTLFYVGLSHPEKSLHIPILIVSCILCIFSIFFAFKGLKTIIDAMFKKY